MPIKTVVSSCPYIPPEWIAAHGWRPRRVVPASPPTEMRSRPSAGVCLYLQSWLCAVQAEPEKDAVIMTTLCDPMRRGAEWMAELVECPVFLFAVPSTWQGSIPRRLYRDELHRLGRFLEKLGGTAPERESLMEWRVNYDAARRNLRNRQHDLSAYRFFEMLVEFHSGSFSASLVNETCPSRGGIPVGILGGPLLRDSTVLLNQIESLGGKIVLNGMENGERTLPLPFDPERFRDDPIEELVHAYFDSIPDPARRPNDGFYTWLQEITLVRALRGLAVLYYPWCDLWHAEIHRIKETLSIPVIDINLGETPGAGDSARALTRIQSWMDLIR